MDGSIYPVAGSGTSKPACAILAFLERSSSIARMIPRRLASELTTALAESPAVALLGPRQVGKTTLALEVAKARPAVYLDLESEADLARLTEPEPYLAQHDDKLVILDEIPRKPQSYLERDIPPLGPRIPAETLRRLWTMLAHQQGGLLNAAALARALAVDAKTVASYLDLLMDLLLVRRLAPWHGNVRKRLRSTGARRRPRRAPPRAPRRPPADDSGRDGPASSEERRRSAHRCELPTAVPRVRREPPRP
jgi:predicted AAA+ superfamily ATPase